MYLPFTKLSVVCIFSVPQQSPGDRLKYNKFLTFSKLPRSLIGQIACFRGPSQKQWVVIALDSSDYKLWRPRVNYRGVINAYLRPMGPLQSLFREGTPPLLGGADSPGGAGGAEGPPPPKKNCVFFVLFCFFCFFYVFCLFFLFFCVLSGSLGSLVYFGFGMQLCFGMGRDRYWGVQLAAFLGN